MTGSPTTNAGNGLLSPDSLQPSHSISNRRRSRSVTPSERSSKSRITLVENDPDLAIDHSPKINDTYKIETWHTPEYTWWDNLLGVFCINRHKPQTMTEKYVQPEAHENTETDESPSPWVLPVYVLSTRKNTDKNHIPQEAKCTIDTGNMQGNLVSREFVLEVLGYSKSNFSKLTAEEEKGGRGVTGHTLVPEGAIYLTWYHQKSTRVFRNMRFLVSPNPHCDLIIGARSILKDRLLDVPNLMSESTAPLDRTFVKLPPGDDKRTELYDNWYEIKQEVNNLGIRKREAERGDEKCEVADLDRNLVEPMQKRDLAAMELQIYDAEHGNDLQKMDPVRRKTIIDGWKKEQKLLPGYVEPKVEPKAIPIIKRTSATGFEKKNPVKKSKNFFSRGTKTNTGNGK